MRRRPPPLPTRADRDPLRWLHECTSRPVDVVMVGDSNQLQDGQGFERGLGRALAALSYPVYASGVISQNENDGAGTHTGMYYSRSGTVGAITGAPAELAAYWTPWGHHDYGYYDDAGSLAVGSASNLNLISTDAIWPFAEAHQFRFGYGTFPSGTGDFQYSVRQEESPFAAVTQDSQRNTVTGSYSHQVGTLAVAADSGRSAWGQMAGRWTKTGLQAVNGPFFCSYTRAVLMGRSAGWSVHSLYAVGGMSLYDMAVSLQSLPAATWGTYWAEVRHRAIALGRQPRMVIYINSGLNDRNETGTSAGPSPAANSSSAGFSDNLTAIRTEIEADYPGDPSELSYWIVPSHAARDSGEAQYASEEVPMEGYRTAAATWAATLPNARCTNLATLYPSAEILADGNYKSSGSDRSHLLAAGYLKAMQRALQF